MKQFINLENEILLENINEKDIELTGIKEDEDGIYNLCEVDDEESFTTVEKLYENGKTYLSFNIIFDFTNNIVFGQFI